MITIVTDSNAMLPGWLRDRYQIRVVPLGLALDGQALLEDEDLDVRAVLEAMREGATLTTSAPSPGAIARVFTEAESAGAQGILAVHIGSDYSSTVESARLAAKLVGLPVEIVDTHLASFSLGCCVWAAAERLSAGDSVSDAVRAIDATSSLMASVFTITELPRSRAGGRFPDGPIPRAGGTPVVALEEQGLRELQWADDLDTAVDAMVAYVAGRPLSRLRVGVGDADADQAGSALTERLRSLPNVAEVVRYRCGPSVAAHTGAGTFGAVLHPLP